MKKKKITQVFERATNPSEKININNEIKKINQKNHIKEYF